MIRCYRLVTVDVIGLENVSLVMIWMHTIVSTAEAACAIGICFGICRDLNARFVICVPNIASAVASWIPFATKQPCT